MYSLDLKSSENEIHSNLLDDSEMKVLSDGINELGVSSHTAIFSSGTTGGPMKGYLLSRDALIKNASAVNQRLGLTADDLWGASLPHYHIGGLAVHYRARLLGHSPVNLRPWDSVQFASLIEQSRVTVISLVPTQLYDLISINAQAPVKLKAVLVGGDFLSEDLERRALALSWPVVRTFGMTEVGSQLCTGSDEAGFLVPLPIHTLKSSAKDQLLVKSESLFSYRLLRSAAGWSFTSAMSLLDNDGFYPLQDRVVIQNGNLVHQGRFDDGIKIKGHLVDLTALKEILDTLMLGEKLWGEMELMIRPNVRESASLVLHTTSQVPLRVIQNFQKLIAPISVEVVNHESNFLRTELGKFKDR